MWIINNQYCSICWPYTSITRWILGLHTSIYLSIISWKILFHSSTMSSFKKLTLVILQPRYTFCSRILQIPKSTRFKSGLFNGQWSGSSSWSCFLSFNISRVSLVVWALAPSCMNKYSLCFISLFFSGIMFLNSTLQ